MRILIILALFLGCTQEATPPCLTCTYADGKAIPLAPCQPFPPVIKDINGNIIPVVCY